MNILNMENRLFINKDKIVLMRVQESNEVKNMQVITGFKVVALLDTGHEVDIYRDFETGKFDICVKWINDYWVNKK